MPVFNKSVPPPFLLLVLTPEQEFDGLGEEETIYKLIGPVLLKQEKFEAENTVKGRLDYINGEM